MTGRRLDVLATPDGHRLPGEFFPHMFKDLQDVSRFQVVQDVAEAITVRVVAPGMDHGERPVAAERDCRGRRVPTLAVTIDRVDDIPLTAAGKLRVVVNNVHTAELVKEQE